MKITLKNTPEQVELIRAIGSKDPRIAQEAQQAFAAFIGPVINQVLSQAGSVGVIYADKEFDEDDTPSFPLDLYYNVDANFITTWSQSMAGGLPTSQIEGINEMKISTYRLDTAVSFNKKYARKSRLDVVSKAVQRMAEEILLKQERNGWAVVLKALAEANTKNNRHVLKTKVNDVFMLTDLSRVITLLRRINASWADGSPVGAESRGVTDLFVSPEVKEQIRAFAFNPMNIKGGNATTITTEAGPGIGLPDSVRERIFNSAGASELYGMNITDLNEFGPNRKYNLLFAEFAGSTDYDSATRSATFAGATDDLIVGLDLGREAFLRPVSRQADSGGTLTTLPDDQWVSRSDKAGFYAFLEEGRVCIDARAVCGIIL
jgi:hypothetical protein